MAKEARQGSRSKATRKGDLKKGDSSIGGTSNLFKEMNVSVSCKHTFTCAFPS